MDFARGDRWTGRPKTRSSPPQTGWQASARNEQGVELLKADATLKFPRKKVMQ